MQDGFVESEGDVSCVEGDVLSDEIWVRVWLHVENYAEDVEGGAGVVLGVNDCWAGEQVGFAAGEIAEFPWVLILLIFCSWDSHNAGEDDR